MRYFFHVSENGVRSEDVSGIELGSDREASDEAFRYLTEVARDAHLRSLAISIGILVKKEGGDVVATVGAIVDTGPQLETYRLVRGRSPWYRIN